jgi:hypothetical protein
VSVPRPLLYSIFALAVAVAAAVFAHGRTRAIRDAYPEADERAYVPPASAARILTLGHNELFADLYWAKTLIYYGGGMEKNSDLADVEPLLALVNRLDPWFRRPYWWGAYGVVYRKGAATSHEFESSVAILERGLQTFPNDWELTWLLGLRYFLDLKSDNPEVQAKYKELGASYIEKAMRLPGAPSDLPILAATLRTRIGQRDRALRELREMILTQNDPEVREQLIAKYSALASADAAEVAEAASAFTDEWQKALPYAPPSLYLLIGPRPASGIDLKSTAQGDVFDVQ